MSVIGSTGVYDQIGANPDNRTWPVMADVDENGDITGISANGINIPIATEYELPAKLQTLADSNTPDSVLVNTGAESGEMRALGVAGASDIVRRSDVDARFPRIFTGDEGSAGSNGEYGFRTDLGIFRAKSAGSWADLSVPTATGEQLYDGTYPAASHTGRQKFVTTWGVWTINEWFVSDGTKWYPASRVLRLFDNTATAATSPVAETALKTDSLPANMLKGVGWLKVRPEFLAVGTNGTKQPKIRFGAAGAGTGGSAIVSNTAAAAAEIYFPFETYMIFTADNAQYMCSFSEGSATGLTIAASVRTTTAINVANACEFCYTGTLGSASDTISVVSSYIEAHWPSKKT